MSEPRGRRRAVVDLTKPTGPPALSPQQLADALGVSRYTIRQEIEAGELRAIRQRSWWRIPYVEARRYAIRIGWVRLVSGDRL